MTQSLHRLLNAHSTYLRWRFVASRSRKLVELHLSHAFSSTPIAKESNDTCCCHAVTVFVKVCLRSSFSSTRFLNVVTYGTESYIRPEILVLLLHWSRKSWQAKNPTDPSPIVVRSTHVVEVPGR